VPIDRGGEAIGFVRQEPDAEDRRATRVWLTAQARRFQPAAERILERIELMAARAEAGTDLPAARRWLKSFAELG
jgi:DNA-binding MarR family transcriptional regulator